MLYEYALEPEAISNWKDFRYFIDNFGIHRGRLIARFPSKWKKMVYEACYQCSEIERKRIVERLQGLDHLLLRGQRQYDPNQSWPENALAQHANNPFHAIITWGNAHNHPAVISADDCVEAGGSPLWQVETQLFIERNALVLANAIAPFFACATEFLFVDPHFTTDDRRGFINPLRQFLLKLAPLEANIRRIEYHLKHDEQKPSHALFESNCTTKVKPLLQPGMGITFVRWEEKTNGREFHARYILTDKGGIMVDPGLDEGPRGEKTKLILLQPNVYQEVWRAFQRHSDTMAYELIDETIVDG